MTDRYLDLLKQGFMKPAKSKRVWVWQHWLPNGEGLSHQGSKQGAEINQLRYGGKIVKVLN